MKIVTRIEMIDVNQDDFYQMPFTSYKPYVTPFSSDNRECESIKLKTTLIKGRHFCYGRDSCIVIGWHPEVEELLNLPFECFENVQKDIEDSYNEGYRKGKNTIWDFIKINGPNTDYWWLPIPIFILIAVLLA